MKAKTMVQKSVLADLLSSVIISQKPVPHQVGRATSCAKFKSRTRRGRISSPRIPSPRAAYRRALSTRAACHRAFSLLLTDRRGLNTVELVVIIAVVIGLALLFRARITGFVTTLLDGLFSEKTAAELVRGVSVP